MITEPTTYQPEIWTVKKDDIYAAITAIESGICYAQECLATHDLSLGRTTRKNKEIPATKLEQAGLVARRSPQQPRSQTEKGE